jgi:pimeloyl-ACP methyl ester carboxylesterase
LTYKIREEKTFRVKAGKVALAGAVRGAGRLRLVFLHGLSANRMCFQFLEKWLSSQISVKTLTYDLRGRGRSDKPEGSYSPEVHAHDLDRLLASRRLKDFSDRKPVLIAHSLGAYAALHFAALFPARVSGLVLIDGGGELSRSEAFRVYALLRLSFIRLGRRFPTQDAYLDLVRKSPLVRQWTPEMEELLRYDMITDERGTGLDLPAHVVESELNSAGGSLSFAKTISMARRGVHGFAAPDYAKIACPVLVIRATERNLFPGDSVLPERALRVLQSRLKDCAVARVRANHYSIILQNQPALNQAIAGFLAQIELRKTQRSSRRART